MLLSIVKRVYKCRKVTKKIRSLQISAPSNVLYLRFLGVRLRVYANKMVYLRPIMKIRTLLATILKVCIPFVIGAAILWWMYRGSDWTVFQRMVLHEMHWGYMALSLAVGVLPAVFRGLRWRMALDPLDEHPSRRVCIDAIFMSYAASLAVPRVGEVTRCGTLKKACGTSFSRSLGTVVTERIVDSALILGISAIAFSSQLFQLMRFMQHTGMNPRAALSRFSLAGYAVTLACIVLILIVVLRLLWQMRAFERGRKFLTDLWAGVLSLRQVRHLWLYLLLSLGIWAGYFFHFYIAFWAFDFTAGYSLWGALLIFCIGSFAVLVPTPNGAGPWHFAVKTMLVLGGVAEQPAVLFALAVHTIQTALVVLLGVVGMVDITLRK